MSINVPLCRLHGSGVRSQKCLKVTSVCLSLPVRDLENFSRLSNQKLSFAVAIQKRVQVEHDHNVCLVESYPFFRVHVNFLLSLPRVRFRALFSFHDIFVSTFIVWSHATVRSICRGYLVVSCSPCPIRPA
jgi:hypothetical protein